MAWCPKCKQEYRKGITVCADCGTTLVEASAEEMEVEAVASIKEEDAAERFVEYLKFSKIKNVRKRFDEEEGTFVIYVKESQIEEAKKLFKGFYISEIEKKEESKKQEDAQGKEDAQEQETDTSDDYDWDAEDEEETDSEDEVKAETKKETKKEKHDRINAEAEANMTDEEKIMFAASTTYVKKADAYQDMHFSGITFIVFGILGIVYLVLCQMGILPLGYSIPVLVVLVIMFVLFIGIGIHSIKKAGTIKGQIGEEEALTKQVENAMDTIFTKELIDSVSDENLTEEENYLAVVEAVKKEIASQFGTDLTEGYVEQVIEEYYAEHFE